VSRDLTANYSALALDIGRASTGPTYRCVAPCSSVLRSERMSKSSFADMPEFLIASLMVAVRQASRVFSHWAVALAVSDRLVQRSCSRSHWGM
jgi:hypothetical protein